MAETVHDNPEAEASGDAPSYATPAPAKRLLSLSYTNQPEGAKIICERLDEGGIVFTLSATSEELAGEIGLGVIVVVLSVLWTWDQLKMGPSDAARVAFGMTTLVVLWAGTFWMVRSKLRMNRIPESLALAAGRFHLSQPTRFGARQREWAIADVAVMRSVASATMFNFTTIGYLHIKLEDGSRYRMFDRQRLGDLDWMVLELIYAAKQCRPARPSPFPKDGPPVKSSNEAAS